MSSGAWPVESRVDDEGLQGFTGLATEQLTTDFNHRIHRKHRKEE